MPQEIEVWYILPAIKRGIAIELVSKGLKQKDIAKLLKVTEASVSNYLKSKRATTIKFNKIVESEIKKSAEKLLSAKENHTNKALIEELQRICAIIKDEKILCKAHKQFDSSISKNCCICKDINH